MRGLLFALVAICVIALGVPIQADAAVQNQTDTIHLDAGATLPADAVLVASEVATESAATVGCTSAACTTEKRHHLARGALHTLIAPAKFVKNHRPHVFARLRGCRVCRR